MIISVSSKQFCYLFVYYNFVLLRDNGYYVFLVLMRKFFCEKNNYEKGYFVVGVDRLVIQLYLYVL